MKNIYKYLLYYLERRVNRGVYTPSSEFIASNSGVCLLSFFIIHLLHFFPDVSTIHQISALVFYTTHHQYTGLNTVYMMLMRLFFFLPSPRYTHNTGTTSGKKVTRETQDKDKEWCINGRNSTATMYTRYSIWCKRTQAGITTRARSM